MSAFVWDEWRAGYDLASASTVEQREALFASEAASWSESRWNGFLVGHKEQSRVALGLKLRDSIARTLEQWRALGDADRVRECEALLAEAESFIDGEVTAEPSEEAN